MERERHGESTRSAGQTAEYRAWAAIKTRCYNSRRPGFKSYGGRGIAVCDRWRTSYTAFLADMGRKPSPDHEIDRIDNDGPYSPENCRWVHYSTNRVNKPTTTRLTAQGKTLTLTEWAQETGLHRNTIPSRIRRGWPVEVAVSTPAGGAK